nr:conserved phage C-terminal domain-containing protein [Clostridium sp.]
MQLLKDNIYEKYLTPTTLFGDKSEKYLNQKNLIVSEKTRYKNNYE